MPIRQEMGAVSLLTSVYANDLFGGAAVSPNTHHALMTLSEVYCVTRPLNSIQHPGFADRDGGASRNGYPFNRLVTARVKRNPSAVRRKYRIGDTLEVLRTGYRHSLEIAQRASRQHVIRNIDQIPAVRRKGQDVAAEGIIQNLIWRRGDEHSSYGLWCNGLRAEGSWQDAWVCFGRGIVRRSAFRRTGYHSVRQLV